jgi:hypothetical protein
VQLVHAEAPPAWVATKLRPQHWVQRWGSFPRVDWSVVALWLARNLLAQHTPPPQVMEILRLGSPGFPRDHGDPEDYLRPTLARAALPPRPPVCGETDSDSCTLPSAHSSLAVRPLFLVFTHLAVFPQKIWR